MVNDKKFVFNQATVNGNPEFIFHTTVLKAGDKFTHEDATMEGPKGRFPALWTTEARAALEGPLLSSGPFKEGEEAKVTVKILDCKPKMKGDVQSSFASTYGVMWHYEVLFEHEGKGIWSTAQSKEQNKNPFTKGETVELIVTVKNKYVNIKKVPGMKPGFGGGSGSKHDAWARVYAAHYNDARKDHDLATAKAMAIATANEVIKKMEV